MNWQMSTQKLLIFEKWKNLKWKYTRQNIIKTHMKTIWNCEAGQDLFQMEKNRHFIGAQTNTSNASFETNNNQKTIKKNEKKEKNKT